MFASMKRLAPLFLSLLFVTAYITGCDSSSVSSTTPSSEKEDTPTSVSPSADASKAYTGTQTDVLLQGFHWESHEENWWSIVNDLAPEIQEAGFTMVWLPPPTSAASDEGYLPSKWYDLDGSQYGTESQLRNAVRALHDENVKVLADIVVNHRVGTTDWADFTEPSFYDNSDAVVSDDEWDGATGTKDTGAGYDAARDLDHTYFSVNDNLKGWLDWLKNDIGFDGWRYDYVKGYDGSYVGEYNDATSPYFSVGEYWPDIDGDYNASCSDVNYHRQKLMDWINATDGKSAAFDFTTKWQLQLAVKNGEYGRLGCVPGAIGWWPEKSVTFVDNHDTGPSPGGGQDLWPFPSDKVEQGYAYILTHPGTPTVYWPHYFDWSSELRNTIETLISIRQNQGLTETSSIEVKAADNSKYAAIIDGKVAVKIGPGSWSPSGDWAVAASGDQWAVWTERFPGYYKIEAKHSGKVLDVADASTSDGAKVHQWSYAGGDNQQWKVVSTGGDYYKIVAKHSGKALDVANASTADGAKVHQWDYVGGDNQQWKVVSTGGDYYKIVAKHSGKVLDVANASTSDGAKVHQWSDVGGDNQRWRLVRVE